MLVVLTETYCNKVNIQITQRDDFIQTVDIISFWNLKKEDAFACKKANVITCMPMPCFCPPSHWEDG